MPPSLAATIGPLGQLYDAPFQADLPVPERFEKVVDFLAGHGFRVYGLSTRTHIHPSQLPAFRACVAQAGLEVHYVSHLSHPFDQPAFLAGRPHASAEVQAQRLRHAGLGGMASYTINPPKAPSCALDQFEADVGMVVDLAGKGVPLHVANGPTANHHLATVEQLLDFCKRLAVKPTISLAAEFLATGHARDLDGWRTVLENVPAGGLYVYANYRASPGTVPHLTIYNDDADAMPPVKPFLQAAFQGHRQPTLLVQGDRPEADALGVMRVQAALQGTDLAFLQDRHRPTRMHRRVATIASESTATQ